MVVVLAAICACSGLVLSFTNKATQAQRENQLLKFVKGPSIQAVLSDYDYDNDPIQDRMALPMGKDKDGNPLEKTIFLAKKDGQVTAVAYASSGSGYGGEIEVMVGLSLDGKLTGISVMTHSETPGLGARITETVFTEQFRGLPLEGGVQLSSDGGAIDGVSGASFSSKGVISAINAAMKLFPKVKEEVS
jgi:electron transport complex protein RnfG